MGAPPVVQEGFAANFSKPEEKKAPPPAEPDGFDLPKTSKTTSVNTEELKKKEAKGFKIPSILKKIWEYIEKATEVVVMLVGIPLKYFGLCILVVGTIHFFVLLCTAAPPLLMTGGVMAVIFLLIKSGALPTIIAGATLYKFGHDLIKHDSFAALNLIPWVLPLPFYQWLSMSKPPSPMDFK